MKIAFKTSKAEFKDIGEENNPNQTRKKQKQSKNKTKKNKAPTFPKSLREIRNSAETRAKCLLLYTM